MTMLVHNTDDALASAVDEPPDSRLAHSGQVYGFLKGDQDKVPELGQLCSPIHDRASTAPCPVPVTPKRLSPSNESGSELSTPRLAVSPSCTESTLGSPSSLSSVQSFTGSLHRGEYADVEDFDLEPELEPVDEVDEVEAVSMAALDLSEPASTEEEPGAYHKYTPGAARLAARTPVPRKNDAPEPEADATPTAAHTKHEAPHATSPPPAPWPLRKGRVFEIIAHGDDMPRTTSPQPREGNDGSSCIEYDLDIPPLPPMPPPNVNPIDTVPAVPSPLSVCVMAETPAEAQADPPAEAPPAEEDVGSSTGTLVPDDHSRGRSSDDSRTPSPRHRQCLGGLLRRNSRASSSTPALKSALCSNEEDRGRRRNRNTSHSVRFSSNAPVEVRTHSPVEYDRKPCPVNNKLCNKDFEELRDLCLPMDLLESRWQSLRGKHPIHASEAEAHDEPEKVHSHMPWQASESPPKEPAAPAGPTTLPLSVYETNEGPAPSAASFAKPASPRTCDPLSDLRKMREQRQCQTRPPSRDRRKARRQSNCSSLGSALAARFGLNQPPPPLPGTGVSPPPSNCSSESLASVPDDPYPSASPYMHDNSSGYESPAADLYDSGSEYDLVA